MAEGSAGSLVLELTAEEALTVLAAVRQYEPYWPASEAPERVAERLHHLSTEIASVIRKIQDAAALL